MNKLILVLMIFGILSCQEKSKEKNEIEVQRNFIPQYFESVNGTCNAQISSYIDSSNGNLCYIASNCYGISVFCMNKLLK